MNRNRQTGMKRDKKVEMSRNRRKGMSGEGKMEIKGRETKLKRKEDGNKQEKTNKMMEEGEKGINKSRQTGIKREWMEIDKIDRQE